MDRVAVLPLLIGGVLIVIFRNRWIALGLFVLVGPLLALGE